MSALTPAGSLATHPLAGLLLALRRERFSGALVLARAGRETRVLLREGLPVHADPGGAGGLAARLVAAGRLPADAPTRIAEHAAARGVAESAAILQLGLLPPRELLEALREELRRCLLDACGWTAGDYRLEPGAAPPDTEPLRIDPLELAREALARHFRPEQLLAGLMARIDRHPQARRGLRALRERLAADEAAARLLDACDGSLSLGTLLEQAAGTGALEAAWLADAAGLLDWLDAPAPREKPELERTDPDAIEISFDGDTSATSAQAGRAQAAAAAGPQTPDAGALRRELLELHGRLAEIDHYALLGVTRDAEPGAIRRAYTAAAKRFHPDALASQGLAELREPATAVFGQIARAYGVLSDAKARRDYDAELAGETAVDAERAVNAEGLYRKAEVMLRMGDFGGALRFLRSAVQLMPEESDYRSALAWALHKKNPPETQSAREHLQKALAAAPANAKAHYRMGVVLRALGDTATGDKHIARARQLDPKEDGR
jgi:tetratricopeptide (TPR) repeat protein